MDMQQLEEEISKYKYSDPRYYYTYLYDYYTYHHRSNIFVVASSLNGNNGSWTNTDDSKDYARRSEKGQQRPKVNLIKPCPKSFAKEWDCTTPHYHSDHTKKAEGAKRRIDAKKKIRSGKSPFCMEAKNLVLCELPNDICKLSSSMHWHINTKKKTIASEGSNGIIVNGEINYSALNDISDKLEEEKLKDVLKSKKTGVKEILQFLGESNDEIESTSNEDFDYPDDISEQPSLDEEVWKIPESELRDDDDEIESTGNEDSSLNYSDDGEGGELSTVFRDIHSVQEKQEANIWTTNVIELNREEVLDDWNLTVIIKLNNGIVRTHKMGKARVGCLMYDGMDRSCIEKAVFKGKSNFTSFSELASAYFDAQFGKLGFDEFVKLFSVQKIGVMLVDSFSSHFYKTKYQAKSYVVVCIDDHFGCDYPSYYFVTKFGTYKNRVTILDVESWMDNSDTYVGVVRTARECYNLFKEPFTTLMVEDSNKIYEPNPMHIKQLRLETEGSAIYTKSSENKLEKELEPDLPEEEWRFILIDSNDKPSAPPADEPEFIEIIPDDVSSISNGKNVTFNEIVTYAPPCVEINEPTCEIVEPQPPMDQLAVQPPPSPSNEPKKPKVHGSKTFNDALIVRTVFINGIEADIIKSWSQIGTEFLEWLGTKKSVHSMDIPKYQYNTMVAPKVIESKKSLFNIFGRFMNPRSRKDGTDHVNYEKKLDMSENIYKYHMDVEIWGRLYSYLMLVCGDMQAGGFMITGDKIINPYPWLMDRVMKEVGSFNKTYFDSGRMYNTVYTVVAVVNTLVSIHTAKISVMPKGFNSSVYA